MQIRDAEDDDITDVISLWEQCGLTRPWNDPRSDIVLARQTPTSRLLVGVDEDQIVATALVGCDGHRGWLYYMAVDPGQQGMGLGQRMLTTAEEFVQSQGASKLQLMVRTDNTQASGFYQASGYLPEDTTVFGKRFDGKTWAVRGAD